MFDEAPEIYDWATLSDNEAHADNQKSPTGFSFFLLSESNKRPHFHSSVVCSFSFPLNK